MATRKVRWSEDRLVNARPETANARRWWRACQVLLLAIAAVETTLWGLAAYYQSASLWVGIAVGVCAGGLTFMVDRALILADSGFDPFAARESGLWPRLRRAWPSLLRLALVGGSVFIVLPVARTGMLHRSVEDQLHRQGDELREEARRSIAASFEPRIGALEERQDQQRRDLLTELAGKGRGNGPGRGVIARQLDADIARDAETLKELAGAKQQALDEVQQADLTWLARRYDLRMPAGDLAARQTIADQLAAEPAYAAQARMAEWVVVVLYLALLILKLSAGEDVEVWLSERAAEAYRAANEGIVPLPPHLRYEPRPLPVHAWLRWARSAGQARMHGSERRAPAALRRDTELHRRATEEELAQLGVELAETIATAGEVDLLRVRDEEKRSVLEEERQALSDRLRSLQQLSHDKMLASERFTHAFLISEDERRMRAQIQVIDARCCELRDDREAQLQSCAALKARYQKLQGQVARALALRDTLRAGRFEALERDAQALAATGDDGEESEVTTWQ